MLMHMLVVHGLSHLLKAFLPVLILMLHTVGCVMHGVLLSSKVSRFGSLRIYFWFQRVLLSLFLLLLLLFFGGVLQVPPRACDKGDEMPWSFFFPLGGDQFTK